MMRRRTGVQCAAFKVTICDLEAGPGSQTPATGVRRVGADHHELRAIIRAISELVQSPTRARRSIGFRSEQTE